MKTLTTMTKFAILGFMAFAMTLQIGCGKNDDGSPSVYYYRNHMGICIASDSGVQVDPIHCNQANNRYTIYNGRCVSVHDYNQIVDQSLCYNNGYNNGYNGGYYNGGFNNGYYNGGFNNGGFNNQWCQFVSCY